MAELVKDTHTSDNKTTEPKKGNSTKCCMIALYVFIGIIVFIGLLFFLWWISNRDYKPTSTSLTTTTSNASGTWTLDMNGTSTMTGLQTDLSSADSGSVTFAMPAEGGTFQATGDWSAEAGGTVGASTNTGESNGKITLSGARKNGKLSITSTLTGLACLGTTTTPIGGATSTDCGQSTPRTFEVDILDNATAASTSSQDYGAYKYNRVENWKLTKVK